MANNIDTKAINDKADLQALLDKDCGQGKKSGRWILYHCPFPEHKNGDKTPSLAYTPANGRWKCFSCNRSGDGIGWLVEYHGMTFLQACESITGGQLPTTSQPRQKPQPQPAYSSPADTWQAAANQVIDVCATLLWQPGGKAALDYLRARGLRDETIKYFRLGYCPTKTEIAGLTVFQGITIPGIIAGNVWYIKIRISQALVNKGWEKYLCISGSKPAAIYNADNLTGSDIALFCEGEFDCMIAHQELNQYLPAATLGSATNTPDTATWGRYLLPLQVILSCYDNDQAGSKGAARLAELAGEKVKLTPIPDQKDLNDYYKTGADLFEWLKPYINLYYFEGVL